MHLRKVGGMYAPLDEWDKEASASIAQGQVVRVDAKKPRNVAFFRKWWALVKLAFDWWEPTEEYKGEPVGKSFENFRKDIIILTGRRHVVASMGGNQVRYEADSISFAKMTEAEFSSLYSDSINVILRRVLNGRMSEEELNSAVERVLQFD
jgi:hypothetical protein